MGEYLTNAELSSTMSPMSDYEVFVMDKDTVNAMIAFLNGDEVENESILDEALDALMDRLPFSWFVQPYATFEGWDNAQWYWWGERSSWADHPTIVDTEGWIRLQKGHACGWNSVITSPHRLTAWRTDEDVFGEGFFQPATLRWVATAAETQP